MLFGHAIQVDGDKDHGYQAEEGQTQLTILIAKLDAKCHAFVKDVVQLEPITNHVDLSCRPQHHLVVHQQFHHLVDGNDPQGQKEIFGVFKFQGSLLIAYSLFSHAECYEASNF